MRSTSTLVVAALLAAAPFAGAQAPDDTQALDRPIRGHAGGHLYYAKPVGEFSEFIDRGFGGAIHGTLLLGSSGAAGLRFDASYMNYGRETVRNVCSLPGNCRVPVDVTTMNNIAFVGAGPILMLPDGPIRPYVGGQAGWTFIWTESSIEDRDDRRTVLDAQNLSDNVFSYGALGGLVLPISAGRTPLALDVGARWLRNGDVRYLRKGDIVDHPTGPPTLHIQRSRADLVTYYVGVSVGVR